MWAYLILFSPPLLYQALSFLKCREDFQIQKLIPQLAVKGFDISILPGAAWFYKLSLYTNPVQPFSYCPSSEFRAIVRMNMLRYPAEDEKTKQDIDHILVLATTGDEYG